MVVIGKQLRKTRMFLGITQEKMCEGSITESYYSRVERGQRDINVNDLIKILNNNHVSLRDFFEIFDGETDQILTFSLSVNDQKELKKLNDKVSDSQKGEDNLEKLALWMRNCSFSELKQATKFIFSDMNIKNLDILNIILINYLNRAYKENAIKEVKTIINYLNHQKEEPSLYLAKIIGGYYNALINQKFSQAEQIKELLETLGYKNYVSSLEGVC